MMMNNTMVLIPNAELKFKRVNVKDLSDGIVFEMVRNGHLTKAQFIQWLEGTRDEWFAIGEHQARLGESS